MVPAAVTGCDMMLCAPREKRMEGLWSPLCPARDCGPRRREAGEVGLGFPLPAGPYPVETHCPSRRGGSRAAILAPSCRWRSCCRHRGSQRSERSAAAYTARGGGEKVRRRSAPRGCARAHTRIHTHTHTHIRGAPRRARAVAGSQLQYPQPSVGPSARRPSFVRALRSHCGSSDRSGNYGMGTAARLSPAIRTALLSLTSFPITTDVIGYGNV